MRAFARLYAELDEASATDDKLAALVRYLRAVPPRDAAWAVRFLIGRRPKRLVPPARLRVWAAQEAGIPDWLFKDSYAAVGDLAETITLLFPDPERPADMPLAHWVEERLLPLEAQQESVRLHELARAWRELGRMERYVWNKLVTGGLRMAAAPGLVVRALAEMSGVDERTIAHRLMGAWEPSSDFFERLMADDTRDADVSRPYAFHPAYPLEEDPARLGSPHEWLAEWKWDGIRAQLVRRAGRVFLWSREEELLSGRFPELEQSGALLPEGTVIEGELLAWSGDAPLPFARLQRRIARKAPGRKMLRESPVILMASDLLEDRGTDLRDRPLLERRDRLSTLLRATPRASRLLLSPALEASGWGELEDARRRARARVAEGIMLKRRASAYGAGLGRGDWWEWKADPHAVNAVLMYAQSGSGLSGGRFTEYTFGLWDGGTLVPFAKTIPGLGDEEIRKVDGFIRRNTLEKFGPVRTVKPELVFEVAFEGAQPSTRHKSGIKVRAPRMSRWLTDRPAAEADKLATVRALIDRDADEAPAERTADPGGRASRGRPAQPLAGLRRRP